MAGVTFGAILLAVVFGGTTPTADEILARHVEALGGRETLDAIRSVVIRGEYREERFTIPDAFVARMRPYYKTICDRGRPPGDFCEGYDGSAWEWYRDPGVVLRTVGAAAAATRHGTDLFDPLVDATTRGTRVELAGADAVDGAPAWDLRVVLADGAERHLLVDRGSYLIVAERKAAPIHASGEPVRSETRFGDYRRVGGVLVPYSVVEVDSGTGRELNRFTVRAVEVNADLDPSFFEPPRFHRTPLQALLEMLYAERSDPAAVMDAYREFRSTHPEVDTRAGIAFIRRQMVKMGDGRVAADRLGGR